MQNVSSIARYLTNVPAYVREEAVSTICEMYIKRLSEWESGSSGFPYKLEKAGIYATEKTKKTVENDIESIRKKITEAVSREIESGKWNIAVVSVNRNIGHGRSELVESLANVYATKQPFTVYQDNVSIEFLSELMTKIVTVASESRSIHVAKDLMYFYLGRDDRSPILTLNQKVMDRLKESKVFREAVVEVATKQLQETPKIAESPGMLDVLRFLIKLTKEDNSIIPNVLPAWVNAVVQVQCSRSYDYILTSLSSSSVPVTDEVCTLFVESLINSLSASNTTNKHFLKNITDTSKDVFDIMVKHNISSTVAIEFYDWVTSLSTLLATYD